MTILYYHQSILKGLLKINKQIYKKGGLKPK